ncbi:hypothetical protein AHF37_09924 [Paragonimus kellicotti]|nr:hypothetical protein AHF37_09924 [Paragonimus kellicotti]
MVTPQSDNHFCPHTRSPRPVTFVADYTTVIANSSWSITMNHYLDSPKSTRLLMTLPRPCLHLPSSKVARRYSTMKAPCDERYCFSGNVMAPLAWFGLTHLLLLRPSEGGIKGGTRLSMLLSSVEMAVHAVKW